ncbi:unnamed protein product, partial [Bubo scandiacus]
MAEAAQGRVQAAVEGAVQGLERERIRAMQGAMFRCSARCCEDSAASMQQVQRCIERCHAPLAQAQAIVTAELEQFQDRLSRCTLHCNDKAKDALEAGGHGGAGAWPARRLLGHLRRRPPPPRPRHGQEDEGQPGRPPAV